MSYERINSITVSNYNITPKLSHYGNKIKVKFSGSCLKQDKITFNHRKTVNIYIVYEINKNYNIRSFSTLENCLFDAIILTKNDDLDKYKYSEYSIGFDRNRKVSVGNGFGRNFIFFRVDMSSSVHVNFSKNDKNVC